MHYMPCLYAYSWTWRKRKIKLLRKSQNWVFFLYHLQVGISHFVPQSLGACVYFLSCICKEIERERSIEGVLIEQTSSSILLATQIYSLDLDPFILVMYNSKFLFSFAHFVASPALRHLRIHKNWTRFYIIILLFFIKPTFTPLLENFL